MRILSLFRIILPISLVMFSCEDPNYPENIWDEDDQGNASPSISSVEPGGSAFAGIDKIINSRGEGSSIGFGAKIKNKAEKKNR